MLGFVLVCALGRLGHRPFSERSLSNADGSIGIRYEPVVRFGAPTIIRFDTRVPPGGDRVAVTIAKDLVDQVGLESITPRPATWEVAGGGIRLVCPVQAGESHALSRTAPARDHRIGGDPATRGGLGTRAALAGNHSACAVLSTAPGSPHRVTWWPCVGERTRTRRRADHDRSHDVPTRGRR